MTVPNRNSFKRAQILSIAKSPKMRQPYLGLSRVSISFGSNHVLRDVSFEVAAGETVCIMGRSGIGKSVCLRLMMGFLKPDAGRVFAAGEDITDYSEEQLEQIHKKITMVFQNGALFDSLTVFDNVAFPLRERRLDEDQICRKVDGLLEMVGAKHIAEFLPAEISTGMKRAVAIARALSASPEAVLYDEPTSMVDPLMARRLGKLIGDLKVRLGLTSVVVTHDTRLAKELSGRIIFLDREKVIFAGTFAEMQRSPEPLVQDFLRLDSFDFRALLRMIEPRDRMTG